MKNAQVVTILMRFSICLMISGCLLSSGYGQSLAFEGAEGYGRYTNGGKGGKTIVVSNLNDKGPGSLRNAIEQKGARVIVFEVSGNIALKKPLYLKNDSITIAGQSAPGKGICIRDYPIKISANQVIIRYLRVRLGDESKIQDDAMSARLVSDLIIDHCSLSWSVDETLSIYDNERTSVQWCIISESLMDSNHEKGKHGYGGIWGGKNASFHHNLIAHHSSRTPRFASEKSAGGFNNVNVDFYNNVIYNWGFNGIYGNEGGEVNIVNNYFKYGPGTDLKKRNRILDSKITTQDKPVGKVFIAGNYVFGDEEVTKDNWNGGVHGKTPLLAKSEQPFNFNETSIDQATYAYKKVLQLSGASIYRDIVDDRVVNDVKEGTAKFKGSKGGIVGLIDSQNDVGSWPDLSRSNESNNPVKNLEILSSINYKAKYDFIVAKDGSGDYKSVQEAINAIPDLRKRRTKILIKPGIYKEVITVASTKSNVTLVGLDRYTTKITFDNFAARLNIFGEPMGTSSSSTVFVYGSGFEAYNLSFENSYGIGSQAVAMRVDGDRAKFINCMFLGNQDTLYLHGHTSRQYYKNCYIEGTVDFIFGWSKAIFEDCEIVCKSKGYITAASTDEGKDFGFVFKSCKIKGDLPAGSVYLGRPWRPYAQTVFLFCDMTEIIKEAGWDNWRNPENEKTAFYGEYMSTGEGASTGNRVKWAKDLSQEEADRYSTFNVFGDWVPVVH